MATIICKNCDTENQAPAMGRTILCRACNQPITLPVHERASETPEPPSEIILLLRDVVRCLRVIAMYIGVLVAVGLALAFGGDGDSALIWVRRGAIFWFVMFVVGWIVLTRKRIV